MVAQKIIVMRIVEMGFFSRRGEPMCRNRTNWMMRLFAVVCGVSLSIASAVIAEEPAKKADPVKPAEPAKPSEPAKPADPAKPAAMPKCPVTGEAVDFSVSASTDDGPVFFCCKGCVSKFEADKSKYSGAVADQRKALAAMPKVQVRCPVMGKPVDEKFSVDHDGTKVLFCCNGCPGKFKKEPAKYKAGLASSYTYQTKCPVTGSPIAPKHSLTLIGGKTVYFATAEARKQFMEKPEPYLANLASQGMKVTAESAHEEAQE